MDELNRIIQNCLDEITDYDYEDYSAVKKASEIILSNRMPIFKNKIKSRFGLSKSLSLAYEFLDSLGYGDYFLDKIDDGTFKFKHVSKKNKENPLSYYNNRLCRSEIYMPYSNSIIDAYSIVHELLHDTNLDMDNMGDTRNIFTEYISMLGEFLLENFIKEKYDINGFKKDVNHNFTCCYNNALLVDFQLNLIKCYLVNGYVNNYYLNTIINKYDPKCHGLLFNFCYSILDNKSLNFDFYMRYLIGILLSCYSYDMFLDKRFDLDSFTYINENMNFLEPDEVYEYLGLEVIDDYNLLLSPDSYDKLDKSYRKILGSR